MSGSPFVLMTNMRAENAVSLLILKIKRKLYHDTDTLKYIFLVILLTSILSINKSVKMPYILTAIYGNSFLHT